MPFHDIVGLTYVPGFLFRLPPAVQRLGAPRRHTPTLAALLANAIVTGRYYWRTHHDGEL